MTRETRECESYRIILSTLIQTQGASFDPKNIDPSKISSSDATLKKAFFACQQSKLKRNAEQHEHNPTEGVIHHSLR